jgi:hypothetical protein
VERADRASADRARGSASETEASETEASRDCGLRRLSLRYNPLGEAGARAFARPLLDGTLGGLEELDLQYSEPGARGSAALRKAAEAPHNAGLRVLFLPTLRVISPLSRTAARGAADGTDGATSDGASLSSTVDAKTDGTADDDSLVRLWGASDAASRAVALSVRMHERREGAIAEAALRREAERATEVETAATGVEAAAAEVEAAAAAEVETPAAVEVEAAAAAQDQAVEAELRLARVRRLARFYADHAPEMAGNAEAVLNRFEGRHERLFRALEKKYGHPVEP